MRAWGEPGRSGHHLTAAGLAGACCVPLTAELKGGEAASGVTGSKAARERVRDGGEGLASRPWISCAIGSPGKQLLLFPGLFATFLPGQALPWCLSRPSRSGWMLASQSSHGASCQGNPHPAACPLPLPNTGSDPVPAEGSGCHHASQPHRTRVLCRRSHSTHSPGIP